MDMCVCARARAHVRMFQHKTSEPISLIHPLFFQPHQVVSVLSATISDTM
jgi:hypothetical protein